jgi:hypothetical protein
MDVQLAETAAERFVLLQVDVLVAEEDHEMAQQGLVDGLDRVVAERPREIDAGNLGPDLWAQRLDPDRFAVHGLPPFGDHSAVHQGRRQRLFTRLLTILQMPPYRVKQRRNGLCADVGKGRATAREGEGAIRPSRRNAAKAACNGGGARHASPAHCPPGDPAGQQAA